MKKIDPATGELNCQKCLKPLELCVCDSIKPIETRTQILILQHPQEPDHELGTARITHLALPNSVLKIGLSWPNLKRALGKEAHPAHWIVLYLGSGLKGESERSSFPSLAFVSQKGLPIPAPNQVEGIVVLDGTWSQAKALWWRNPWLLKLKRAILKPTHPSLYKELRREPRRECLSTLESVAEALDALGEPQEISGSLRTLFAELLRKKRTKEGKKSL